MAVRRGSKSIVWSVLAQVLQAQPWRQAGREERGRVLAEGLTSVSGL